MLLRIPKRNKVIEANGPDAMLDALREDALLPAANLDQYKIELRSRLGAWFGIKVTSDDTMFLLRLLEKAGAIIIVED